MTTSPAEPPRRLPAHLRILALVGFMLLVVATPHHWYGAYAGYAVALAVVVGLSRVRIRTLLRRMSIETPVAVFALLLPFVARGPRTEVLGVAVSESGLRAAVTLLITATIGVVAGLTLAGSTPAHDLIRGLERLRVPHLLVQIAGFMFRYLDVVTDDLRRMRIARESRGFRARDPRQWTVLARSLGALFIRSFERGERVHLAMVSRGYTGRLPE